MPRKNRNRQRNNRWRRRQPNNRRTVSSSQTLLNMEKYLPAKSDQEKVTHHTDIVGVWNRKSQALIVSYVCDEGTLSEDQVKKIAIRASNSARAAWDFIRRYQILSDESREKIFDIFKKWVRLLSEDIDKLKRFESKSNIRWFIPECFWLLDTEKWYLSEFLAYFMCLGLKQFLPHGMYVQLLPDLLKKVDSCRETEKIVFQFHDKHLPNELSNWENKNDSFIGGLEHEPTRIFEIN